MATHALRRTRMGAIRHICRVLVARRAKIRGSEHKATAHSEFATCVRRARSRQSACISHIIPMLPSSKLLSSPSGGSARHCDRPGSGTALRKRNRELTDQDSVVGGCWHTLFLAASVTCARYLTPASEPPSDSRGAYSLRPQWVTISKRRRVWQTD